MSTITREQLAEAVGVLGLGDPNRVTQIIINSENVTVTKFAVGDDGHLVRLDKYNTNAKYVETYEVV